MGTTSRLDFFFLVGCPRSGTTLLQRLLDAHPDVAVAPETFFVERFWQRREDYGPLTDQRCFERLLGDICAVPEFEEMGLSRDEFFARASDARTYPALFEVWLTLYAEHRGVTCVGEKTPNHALHLHTLQGFFPECRVINIIRDPRAVVSSLSHVPWSKGTKGNSETWRHYAKTARRAMARDDARLTTVRYEELVTAPERKLAELCRFLRRQYDPDMMNFPSKASNVNAEREPWKKNVMKPVSLESLDAWRRELTPAQVEQIEAVALWEMRHSGYTQFQTPAYTLFPSAFRHLASKAVKRLPSIQERVRQYAWRKSEESVAVPGE